MRRTSSTMRYRLTPQFYMLREDVTYKLNPKLQLESGFLYAFNPATSSENGWIEENFEVERDLDYTVETPDGEVIEESTFEEGTGRIRTRFLPCRRVSTRTL